MNGPRLFSHSSIRRKLTWFITATTTISFILMGVVIVAYEWPVHSDRFAIRLISPIVIGALLASLVVACSLSLVLQRMISKPLLKLAEIMRLVSGQKDYAARANKQSNDEIGLLSEAFNHMLEQIQLQDTVLRQHRDQLERLMADQTHELSVANTDLEHTSHALELTRAALVQEKERALVTLRSLRDAVIIIDATGSVEYLNPTAERLTGWGLQEAKRQPLSSVFRVLDEDTEQPVIDPVSRCLSEADTVQTAETLILIDRWGQKYAIENSAAPLVSAAGAVLGVVTMFRDVSDARRIQKRIFHQATHDALTGLANRYEFERLLKILLQEVGQTQSEHALCFLDLDRFKAVNDTAGHLAGDELLRQITTLLVSKLRSSDTLARLGGDEFGALLRYCSLDNAQKVAEILRQTVQDFRLSWAGNTYSVGVSIGIVTITATCGSDPAVLLSDADAAMYTAKENGRNRVHVLQPGSAVPTHRRGEAHWVKAIRQASEENRFQLYYQAIEPLQPLPTRQGLHYEILVRMLDEQRQPIDPATFLPAAERHQQMATIDRWVVQATFNRLEKIMAQIDRVYLCSMNLSSQSLADDKFLAFVADLLEKSPVPGHKVCFEFSETFAITHVFQVTQFMAACANSGCKFALDDFGGGMSSFRHLKSLPVDFLKIDRSLVKTIADSAADLAIVQSMTDIGHALGKQVIAIGVENQAIAEKLKIIGVDYLQGYSISRPRPFISSLVQTDLQ